VPSGRPDAKKVEGFLNEWNTVKDSAEAFTCFKELGDGDAVVEAAITMAMDCKSSVRASLIELLNLLVAEKLLGPSNFVESIDSAAFEFLEDIAIDIPNVHVNLAEILAPLVLAGVVLFENLTSQCSKAPKKLAVKFFEALSTQLETREPGCAAAKSATECAASL